VPDVHDVDRRLQRRRPHLAQNVDVAIAAAADPGALRQHARDRGWRNLRLLSCGNSTFKHDLRSEDAAGNPDSTISVFTRDRDGTLRHVYSAHPWMADDVKERGIALLTPSTTCSISHRRDAVTGMRNLSTLSVQRSRDCGDKVLSRLT
jgi:predicted dithiol-disulfide oxidoreductase (DUF899 family)